MPDSPLAQPLILQRADPWMLRHDDGFYYFTGSVPQYDRIELRRAKTIDGLATAPTVDVWKKHTAGAMGAHIWAPELHFIDGCWYIYFAAGAAERVWDIRIYVLQNQNPNPLEGDWKELGQLKTDFESFSLDATTFEHGGTRFLVWAQHNPELKNNTSLYIAKMVNPWTIAGPQVQISAPEFEWERQLFSVNEGPAVLKRNGKVFIAYSASGTNHHYCMGLLAADETANLLVAANWSKSASPVFSTNESRGHFGPGHNSFTSLQDGSDAMVFHARQYRDIVGDPLHDPNRHTFVQSVDWQKDGRPDFELKSSFKFV